MIKIGTLCIVINLKPDHPHKDAEGCVVTVLGSLIDVPLQIGGGVCYPISVPKCSSTFGKRGMFARPPNLLPISDPDANIDTKHDLELEMG